MSNRLNSQLQSSPKLQFQVVTCTLRKTFRHDVRALDRPPPKSHALSQPQCRSLGLTPPTPNRRTPSPHGPPRESPLLRGNIDRGAMGGMEATDLARILPALPISRGGTSRDAILSNRRTGCGGRRGSRQIRARRPRQERRGREGEQEPPPERSPRLRRPRGPRTAAGTMLEPECAAPGARGASAGRLGLARRGSGGAASGP